MLEIGGCLNGLEYQRGGLMWRDIDMEGDGWDRYNDLLGRWVVDMEGKGCDAVFK